ncbi:MAG: uroporphyrinogen-III C-methyltransferase [Pseudomonadota bacterium]
MTTQLPKYDWPVFEPGWVWLCGAGPGDAGLLTLHALNALQQADVVVHDALIGDHILSWVRDSAEIIYAGKKGGKPSPKQKDISLRLVERARSGLRVLRLKGGDPFVFGRGGEEAQTLVQHGIPIRIIPGITAAIGGLAYAGIPATHRDVNQSVTFVTGHDQSGKSPSSLDWAAIAKGSQVIMIYMGMKHFPKIAGDLIDGGRDPNDPVGIVTSAATDDQTTFETTLAECRDPGHIAHLSPPSLICIGRVVLLRQVLDWMGAIAGNAPRNLDPLGRGRPAEAS